MTQSGQGEEPSARTAREGIVLPSDGGAPLHPSDLPPAPLPPAPPRTWDQRGPWGAEEPAAPAEHWNGAPSAPSAPEWGGQGSQGAYDTYGTQAAYGTPGGTPLPPEGSQGQAYGLAGYGGAGSGAPLPPVAGEVATPQAPMDEGATQYIPPVPAAGAMPMDEGPTQFLPPVVGQAPAAEAATQFLPPVGPGALPPEASADATAYLARVPDHGAGPMPSTGHPGQPPHAMPGGNPDAQPTQFLPPVAAQTPAPSQPYGAPGQPRPRQRRQPQQQPDVFDSLFRSDAGAAGVSGATQQMPKIDPARDPQPPQGPGGHGGHGGHAGRSSSARRESGGAGGGRTKSRVPLIALVGVGIAVLGIGAGALMAGSGDKESPSVNTPVAATGEPEDSKASADPAKEQAVALDKLLADSGNSRNSVIKAVANIKTCTNLGQAATDLRDAAKQRNELVTRLGELSVDKLPGHEALTASLTKAWQASASADDHYAAWADQSAGRKGCRKGQARPTGQTQAGNAASGTASAEKAKAAKLWNTIAAKYGLTQRQAVQL